MPGLVALTTRQEQVLAFIRIDCGKRASPLRFRRPLTTLGSELNSVRQHLCLIEKKGFVHRLSGRSGALVLDRQETLGDSGSVHVPLLGRISAGPPAVRRKTSTRFSRSLRIYSEASG